MFWLCVGSYAGELCFDSIMQYIMAQYEEYVRNETYRVYISDALMVIAGNTAKYQGDRTISPRYIDLFKPKDTRKPEEIVEDILDRAGLVIE